MFLVWGAVNGGRGRAGTALRRGQASGALGIRGLSVCMEQVIHP